MSKKRKCWLGAVISLAGNAANGIINNVQQRREKEEQEALMRINNTVLQNNNRMNYAAQQANNISQILVGNQGIQDTLDETYRNMARYGKRKSLKRNSSTGEITMDYPEDMIQIKPNVYYDNSVSHEEGGNTLYKNGKEVFEEQEGEILDLSKPNEARVISDKYVDKDGNTLVDNVLNGKESLDSAFNNQERAKKAARSDSNSTSKYKQVNHRSLKKGGSQSKKKAEFGLQERIPLYSRINPNSHQYMYDAKLGNYSIPGDIRTPYTPVDVVPENYTYENDTPWLDREIGRSGLTRGDAIGVGAGLLNAGLGFMFNRLARRNRVLPEYVGDYTPALASFASYNTRYNVEPQVQEIRRNADLARRISSNKTMSSATDFARHNAIGANEADQANKIFAAGSNYSANATNEMNKLNTSIGQGNIQSINAALQANNTLRQHHYDNVANIKNAFADLDRQNNIQFTTNIGQAIQNGLAIREQNYNTAAQLMMHEMAAQPEVLEYMRSYPAYDRLLRRYRLKYGGRKTI